MKLRDRLLLSGVVFCYLMLPEGSLAQITPDDSLGGERSRLTPNVTVRGLAADRIDGGAARGANLYHSFQDFNVSEGQRVYFGNPAGVENILSRVTGTDISDILGTLGVDGTANLFLLNPNGIIFGPNARLDISGSFTASTGDRFTFPDGSEFSATNPQTPPLLTINVPIGLQLGQRAIENQAVLSSGQNLTLSGSSVTSTAPLFASNGTLQIESSGNIQVQDISAGAANLRSTAGNIQVGNINTAAENPRGNQPRPFEETVTYRTIPGGPTTLSAPQGTVVAGSYQGSFLDVQAGGDIAIARSSDNVGAIDASASSSSGRGIFVRSTNGNINLGNIYTSAFLFPISAGSITLAAPLGSITIGETLAIASVRGFFSGSGGNVNITAGRGIQTAGIDARSEGGQGGDISITSTNGSITTENLNASGINQGGGGTVTITTENGNLETRNIFVASWINRGYSAQDGGRILLNIGGNISTGNLNTIAAGPGTSTQSSRSGDIVVQAARRIVLGNRDLDGNGTLDSIYYQTSTGNQSAGGNVSLLASEIELDNNSSIRSETRAGGQGGSITLNADTITLSNGSSLNANTTANGQSGNIVIDTDSLLITNGSHIDTSTSGQGNAGQVTINAANTVLMNGNGTGIFSRLQPGATVNTNSATRRSGGIRITTPSLSLLGNSRLETSATSYGIAGDIAINTSGSFEIQTGGVFSNADAFGILARGGNIDITTGALSVLDGGELYAATGAQGNAGNITIRATGTVLFSGVDPDPDINLGPSSAVSSITGTGRGNGGNIDITAQRLELLDGGILSVFVEPGGQGNGGIVRINASEVIASGQGRKVGSGFIARTDRGSIGQGGTVSILSDTVQFLNNASIIADTLNASNGGDVSITARNLTLDNSTITVEAASSGNAGTIAINTDFLSITGQQGSRISATATNTATAQARGGEIFINSSSVNLSGQGNGVFARTEGDAQAGNVRLQPYASSGSASNLSINLLDGATISASTSGAGAGGDIALTAPETITIQGNGQLVAETSGAGLAGDITLRSQDLVINNAQISTAATATATAQATSGNIVVNSDRITLSGNRRVLSSSTAGAANGGNITLRPQLTNAIDVSFTDNAEIAARTEGDGEGGNIFLGGNPEAPDLLLPLDSVTLAGQGRVSVEATGAGSAGVLGINASRFNLGPGVDFSAASVISRGGRVAVFNQAAVFNLRDARIIASTDTGTPGGIIVQASDSILLSGIAGLFAEGGNNPSGGIITVSTPLLTLENGAQINTSTNSGVGGDVSVSANRIFIRGNEDEAVRPTGIFSSSRSGTSGSIAINGETLRVEDGEISAETQTGIGGDIALNTTQSVVLDGDRTGVTVETTNGGLAGRLGVTTPALQLSDGARVAVSAQDGITPGNAGDLVITANTVNLNNQATITATSNGGRGGNIQLQNLDQLNLSASDISASTQSGEGGNITVNANQATLNNNATISATSTTGRGGNIQLQNDQLALSNSSISASAQSGEGGSVIVNADRVTLDNNATIATTSTAGLGGNIQLQDVDQLTLSNSDISASTQRGEGGSVIVNADRVTLDNSATIAATSTTGQGGSIQLQDLDQLTLASSSISASTEDGTGGNITVNGGRVTLNDNAEIAATSTTGQGGSIQLQDLNRLALLNSDISASTRDGVAGDVLVEADESIRIVGKLVDPDQEGISVIARGEGIAGRLRIVTNRLSLQDGATISVQANGSGDRTQRPTAIVPSTLRQRPGDAGDLTIEAQTVTLSNESSITAASNGGQGGTVRLRELDSLRLNTRSNISASTRTGTGGSLSANFRPGGVFNLTGNSQLAVEATEVGTAGDLIVRNANSIRVNNRSSLTVSSPRGEAGDLRIVDAGTVTLNNGFLSAIAGTGDNGNIVLTMSGRLLRLNNGSEISAQALNSADGGRITLNVPNGFVVTNSLDDNDIIASASGIGNGGSVQINTIGIFGLQERATDTQYSDIVVSSTFGTNGTVELNTLGIDPTRGLTELPTTVEPPTQVARGCGTSPSEAIASAQGSFVVRGRGGLPSNPGDILNSDPVTNDWVALDESAASQAVSVPEDPENEPISEIVEAQGWIINEKGEVEMVATVPTSTPQTAALSTPACSVNPS